MNPKEFERCVAGNTPWGLTALDQRTRVLRESGLLPTGAHGRHAPDITPGAAKNVVISLAAPTALESARFVTAYAPLVEKEGHFLRCPFGEAMEEILGKYDLAAEIAEVRINQSWPEALILLDRGDLVRFGPQDQPETGYGWLASVQIVLRKSLLCALAHEISVPGSAVTAGWGKPPTEAELRRGHE